MQVGTAHHPPTPVVSESHPFFLTSRPWAQEHNDRVIRNSEARLEAIKQERRRSSNEKAEAIAKMAAEREAQRHALNASMTLETIRDDSQRGNEGDSQRLGSRQGSGSSMHFGSRQDSGSMHAGSPISSSNNSAR
jgi:hypothetical protein